MNGEELRCLGTERSEAGPAQGVHEPREAPAGAPSLQQPPRSRRGRSLQAPARPRVSAPRPAARRRSARSRSHPAPAPVGPGTHRRPGRSCLPLPPLHRQYGDSTGIHFRFRGSGAGHSPGAAPLLAPGGEGGAAAPGEAGRWEVCAVREGGRGAGGTVPAERWEGCVWPVSGDGHRAVPAGTERRTGQGARR